MNFQRLLAKRYCDHWHAVGINGLGWEMETASGFGWSPEFG